MLKSTSTSALVLAAAVCAAASWLAAPVEASQPSDWHFADGADFAKGRLKGLSLHQTLGLSVAPKLVRHEVPAAFIHCWVRDGSKLWLGTGLEAKVFRLDGKKVELVADLDGALVGSLETDGRGGVYAGLVGSGKVMHVDGRGTKKLVIKLKEARHIWALKRRGALLFAGTGPGGKIIEIDPKAGTSKVFATTDTEHVLDLLLDRKSLVAATSAPAMLVRVQTDGKVRAIAGFPGGEVRSVARLGDTLFAAVNGGRASMRLTRLRATPKRPGKSKARKVTKAKSKKSKRRAARGKGSVWARTDSGRVYRLFVSPEGMISQVGAVGQGVVAGAARGGRVVIGDLAGEVESLFDLKEKQVLGVEMGAKGPRSIFTGNGAAVYVTEGMADEPVYTSDVLRETGVARWGRLQTGGSGKISVQTRSGFADPPGDTWSEWQPLKNGRIQSPPARFLQFRVFFKSPRSRLTEVRVHRRLFNRKPTVSRLLVKRDLKKKLYRVSWRGLDRDRDKLGYVVTYRMRGSKQWLMLHDRYYTKTSLMISPRDMPDGWYEIRVEASDALTNSPSEALKNARISKPFLVDQGRPQVAGEIRDGVLTGVAADRVSNIVQVKVSFDGEPPVLAKSGDGVFDGQQEAFELKLPKDLLNGNHTLLIQATDEAGNIGVQRLTIGQK